MGLRSVDLKKEKLRKWKFASSEPILELRNVTLFYKKRMILEQISMKAAQGEVIAVVGHNGAGKTTFSRSLCGLHKDYTGDFYWKGIPINNKARLKLSYMVMQDVNYELFAESVRAECSFGSQSACKTFRRYDRPIGAYAISEQTPEHSFRRAETTGSCCSQYDLWKRTSDIR